MKEKRLTRGQAIRKKCLDCCCGDKTEVRKCHITDCTLWAFRLGSEEKSRKTSVRV